MSKVAIQGNASGTGTFTIAAPNSNTDRTLTLPDEAGTVLTSVSTLSSSNLSGALPAIDGSALTGIDLSGTIVQIVTSSTETQTTKTGSSYANTALAATINKQQSSSKILILMSAQLQAYRSGSGEARGKARIVRDGTEVLDFRMTTRSYDGGNLHVVSALQALNAIDTTTGTGNRTYTLQIANNDTDAGTDYRLNVDGGSRSSVILLEIS